jgi:hypothetical protein
MLSPDPPSTDVESTRIPTAELPAVVLGRPSAIARSAAIAQLASSTLPGREAVLATLLVDTTEESALRVAAANALADVAGDIAADALLAAAATVDGAPQAAVLRALGRIGDERALEGLLHMDLPKAGPSVPAHAFAVNLIEHRLGIEATAPARASEGEVLRPPTGDGRDIRTSAAATTSREQLRTWATRRPYNIDLEDERATEIVCAGMSHFVLANREVATGDPSLLSERPFITAIVASRPGEDREYTTSYVVLSTPMEGDAVSLAVHRQNGREVMVGTGTTEQDVFAFELLAVRRPGARALDLRGTLAAGQVTITQGRESSRQEPPRLAQRLEVDRHPRQQA